MTCSATGPRIASKSASGWFRRVATNAFTASSAAGKLRCGSGVLGGAAWAKLNQRRAIVAHGQRLCIGIGDPPLPEILSDVTCQEDSRYTSAPRRGKG